MDELVSLRYTASQLRFAFVVLLEQDAKPRTLYEKYETHLMKDFLDRGLSKDTARQELQRTLKASWLAQGNTEEAWVLHSPAHPTTARGAPVPDFTHCTPATAASEANRLWNLIKRDPDQSGAAKDVIDGVRSGASKLIFCQGRAGCGKSTLAKYISYYVRSLGKSCVNVASTGIAALNLPDGATAHSTFKIPIEDAEHLTCRLGHSSAGALTIAAAAVIQWDEWPSCKRAAWDAVLDYLALLQQARPDIYVPKVIITYGDFRQIPPVLKHASRQDVRAASVTTSASWPSFRTWQLRTTHRQIHDSDYASWIERIGQGEVPHTHTIDGEPGYIELDRCSVTHTMDDAITHCFPHINDPAECADRKILTATIEARNTFNDRILDTLTRTYLLHEFIAKSSDAIEYDSNNDTVEDHITAEFLNLQDENGVPPHALRLVVGGLYELMRNFSPCDRLMNHTHVVLKSVYEKHVLVERPAGNAVLDTSVPVRAQPDVGDRIRASLYTVNVTIEMVDTPTKANAGSRLALSDGISMRSGAPANRHGLTTTVKRATDLLKLNQPPNGVCVSAEGLQPPQAGHNPTSGRSWAWVVAAYGDSARAASLATEYVATRAVDIITHCFLKADLHVPATDTQCAWSAKSTLLNNRVSIRRTGSMTNGQTYELNDLINFVYTIHPNVPPKVARALKDFFDAYPSIITEGAGPALVGPASTTVHHSTSAAAAAPKRGVKRPPAPSAAKKAKKR
ncbi:unnamed protein product [Prorocentrum cordatum]|uniref:ATP-dependent DNA helicase n=1 Tax=Prorocentrum cordatum TaxID=2364126 RepID=A0ABN9P709_9DINO|nr:unnamed protein product [Polarella glacialis]